MGNAYQTFVRNIGDLRLGTQTLLVLRDLTAGRRKYFAQNVIAVVSTEADPAGESRPLIVRSPVGNVFPGSWYVKILRTLPSRVPGTPYTSAFEAMHAAWGNLLVRSPASRAQP